MRLPHRQHADLHHLRQGGPEAGLPGHRPGGLVAAARACFSNTVQRLRVLQVAPEVIITPYADDAGEVTMEQLSGFYGTEDDDTPPLAEVWKIQLTDGTVTGVEQFPIGVLVS